MAQGGRGRPGLSLDDQAMIRLVSYDYLFANIQEMEESIERAVITSSVAVGSSKIITCGSFTMVRAMETFCFWPLESLSQR